ncbi:MAG: hypothetical protein WCO94_09490 [Verrucomicrobiota bacterium]
MNIRKLWTELFQQLAGRPILFLVADAIILAFLLLHCGPVPEQATAAKAYSYEEQILLTEATDAPFPDKGGVSKESNFLP